MTARLHRTTLCTCPLCAERRARQGARRVAVALFLASAAGLSIALAITSPALGIGAIALMVLAFLVSLKG